MEIQPKLCEFKVLIFTNKKSKVVASKKFDMTKRINSTNKASIDLGKGVHLLIKMAFKQAHPTLDADLIKRDTVMLNDEDEEEAKNSGNPYMDSNLMSSEIMGRTMSVTP